MSVSRYISSSFWSDDWVDSLSVYEKLLYMYLLTNEKTNVAGVYKITLKRIKDDTGISKEKIVAALNKFNADKKAFYFKEYMIIPRWPKHQKLGDRGTLKLGMLATLKALPAEIKAFIIQPGHYDYDLSFLKDDPCMPHDDPYMGHAEKGQNGDGLSDDLDLDSDLDSDKNNKTPGKAGGEKPKPKKLPLRDREPINDMERVEKAYLQNWDMLHSQQQVKTAEPVVNYGQTRALLKNLFRRIKADQIIAAINAGLNDDFVMNGGYSLSTMLSASVLNRLINSASKITSQHNKKNLGELEI